MNKRILGRALLAATLFSAGGLASAETPPAEVLPTCTGPAHHALDFWLGTWRVTDAKGTYRGTNEITRGPGGCGLIEHWKGPQKGNVGTSLNGYDPVTEEWAQYWVSPTETVYVKGKFGADGVLRTTGTITYYNSHEVHGFRSDWIPNPDGTLRNESFEQDPKTGQWSDWFTGYYHKQS